MHRCGTRYATKRGKEVEGGVCRPCRTCAIHVPVLPAQSISIWRKGLQLLSSFLYYFSLSYLDRPSSMGAEVGRFERFVFLFLALFCQAFCFCFLGQ